MSIIFRRFIALFLSLFLVIYPTIQQANAASSWNVTSVATAGGRVIVSASKAGYKSAINIAPTAGRLGVKLAKGANWAALLYAALELAPDLADIKSFQPQYAQNRVKYTVPAGANSFWYAGAGINSGIPHNSASEAGAEVCSRFGHAFVDISRYFTDYAYVRCKKSDGNIDTWDVKKKSSSAITDYISIDKAAAQVVKNANSGHAPSQAAVREAAIEMVATGDFDADFLSGAVPTSDTKPLIPSIPGTQNGNQEYGGVGVGDGADGTMNGATPGEQADAAKDAAEKAKNAADAAKDAAKDASEQAAKESGKARDVINSGADQAEIDAAEAKAAAATKAAADAKAVADAAIAAANERAAAAERAAEAATKSAADAATKAAADLAAAKAAGDAAAIAAAEAAKAAADTAVAAAKEKQAAAEKAAEKAKAEAAKPFELPAFCTWAKPVCDAIEWLQKPAPDIGEDSELDIDITDVAPVDTDINFGGSCPANFEFNGSIFGNSINIVLLDTSKFCGFLSTFVKFPVYAASSLFALYILGGRKDG